MITRRSRLEQIKSANAGVMASAADSVFGVIIIAVVLWVSFR